MLSSKSIRTTPNLVLVRGALEHSFCRTKWCVVLHHHVCGRFGEGGSGLAKNSEIRLAVCQVGSTPLAALVVGGEVVSVLASRAPPIIAVLEAFRREQLRDYFPQPRGLGLQFPNIVWYIVGMRVWTGVRWVERSAALLWHCAVDAIKFIFYSRQRGPLGARRHRRRHKGRTNREVAGVYVLHR